MSPVLPRENSSTTVGVLEFSYGSTGLVAVVDLFFVMVKRQILLDACPPEGSKDDSLILGREYQFTASISEVLVSSELSNQGPHESLILFGEHLLLETCESTSEHGGLSTAIELAFFTLCGFPRVDE